MQRCIKYLYLHINNIYVTIRGRIQFELYQREWKRRNSHNHVTVRHMCPFDKVSIGKHSYGMLNMVNSDPYERLILGNFVSIAEGVVFVVCGDHRTETVSTFPFRWSLEGRGETAISKGPVIVEDDVWIGTNSIILSGVTIGKGSIIAAGSVVAKDVPPYAIVGGVPAKVIKYRFSEEIINVLKEIDFGTISDDVLRDNLDILYKQIVTVQDAINIANILNPDNIDVDEKI